MISDALELLNQPTPPAAELPARIEQLELHASTLQEQINGLAELAADIEESAALEAAGESNADKRKARRTEILRADDRYLEIKREAYEYERAKFRLDLRAHRYGREFRLHVAETQAAGAFV